MLTRRRAALGGILVLLAAMVAGLVAARDDDPSDRASVESVDRTTSTTRRRAVTTTSEGSTTTTSATPPSSEATAPSAAAGGGGGRPPTTRSTPGTTAAPLPPPSPPPPPSGLAVARIRLTPVASASYPIAMAVHPPTGAIWIAQKGGSVCRLQGGACTGTQTVASVSTADLEQGLLGIAFSPAGDRFFASYTDPVGDTRVDRFAAGSAGAPMGGGTTIYAQDQPYGNHNGGNILFGPDGAFYLGLGDGGSAGDPHGNAQDPGTDLGKIVRMDQDGGSRSHYVSGVRNPWRFSFDRATGDLWVADVGQGSWEEVDLLPAGAQGGRNLGWSCYEGAHVYSGCTPSGTYVGPIFEYSHAEGCSVTGGYVYRGSRVPDLVGAYLFADYCDGELRGLTQQGGRVTLERRLGVNPGNVVSFGQDAAGELYVLTPSAVFRIDPA